MIPVFAAEKEADKPVASAEDEILVTDWRSFQYLLEVFQGNALFL